MPLHPVHRPLALTSSVLCVAFVLGLPRPVTPQTAGSTLRALLPLVAVDAEVLEPWTPPRLLALTAKLQQAAQADPEWWRQHIQRGVPGRPLVYDARMGLSEGEYHEMLALADSIEMRPARTIRLALEATAAGWRFPDDVAVAALRGIEVDTATDHVRTGFGILDTRSILAASAAQRATGRWSGPQWKLERLDATTLSGTAATFAVGRLEASGLTLIYFDAKQAENGRFTRRESVMLRLSPRP